MNYANQSKGIQIEALEQLNVHDHICSIYNTKEEQFSVIVPFIKIGLERGEKCIYAVNDNTAHEVQVAMQTGGIDTDSALKSGALSILNRQEFFLKQGPFEPDWMIQFLKETTDSAKSEGFNALRLAAEMTWLFGVEKGAERLSDYESKINSFFPENDIVAICQYDRMQFLPETILNIIRTHPIVVYGGVVCKNFYYVPPDEYLKPDQTSLEIDRLLDNLQNNKQRELELKASKDKFKDLLDNANDLIQSVSPDGRFVYVNQAWRKELGYNDEEVANLTMFDIIHPNSQAHCMEVFQRVISGETVDKIEATFVAKDGKKILVEGSANCRLENGKPVNTRGIFRDVTERKLSDERIGSFAHILEESLNEIYIFDSNTLGFIQVNKGARLNLGYSMEEISNLTPLDLKPEFTAESFAKMVEPLRKDEKQKIQFETVHRRKDGSLYDVEVHLQLSTFQTIPAFVAIILDITERKQAEDRLKYSFEQTRVWLDNSPVCTKVVDLDFNLRYMSAAGIKALKVEDVTKLYGKPYPFDFFPEAFKNSMTKNLEKVKETCEIITEEAPIADIEGNELWFQATLVPVKDIEGRIDFIIIVSVVINKRVKTEEQIRKLSHAIEHSSATVVITDTEGNIEYANPKFTSLTGYSIEDVIGKNSRILKSGKTDPKVYKELWKTIISGNEWRGEFNNRKKNGELYWEAVSISPVKNEEGVITSYIAVKYDITEKKKMEEALLHSERLKSIGTITAGISHEFNNILAIISGNVQLLEISRKDDEELMDALRTVKRATNDGVQISMRMLKSTKTTIGTAGFVPFDINKLINQAIDFTMPRWKNMAQAKGINYYMVKEDVKEVTVILCNPTELREVFVNIINNALDAMWPDGGYISFNTWSEEDTVFTSISDTGEGMTEDIKKNMFDPFFTTRIAIGAGLGMSMVYGIVTRHDGKIEVETEVGNGSTFTLQFPTATKTVSPKESPEPEQDIKSKSLRILVVDDEKNICELLGKLLSEVGRKVKTVDNGAEAIELAKSEDFDLVLCDIAMPVVCGYDVIKALNKLKKRPKIGIITGWDEKLKPLENEDLKVDFIIKKPFDLSELTKNINDAFNNG